VVDELLGGGKGSKYRTVPLNADARRTLQAYLEERPQVDVDYLFAGQRVEPLRPSGIRYLVRLYAYDARLEGVTPHTLRHTFGENLVDAGVSLDRVAQLLGHEGVETTAIYTKPPEEDIAEAGDLSSRVALAENHSQKKQRRQIRLRQHTGLMVIHLAHLLWMRT
jgi:site-specific recombinase XerD